MTRPQREFNANQVVLELLELSRHLQVLSDQLDALEEEAVEAKEEHTVAYAQAYLKNSPAILKQKITVGEREQMTMLDTRETRLRADILQAKLRAHKNQISTLKVRIEVGRSAAALVRAEADLFNTGNTSTRRG